MKTMKALLLIFIFSLSLSSFSINLVVNDKVISTEDYQVKPEIINNRTYVPLRFVSEALGYKITWDGNNKQVLISDKSNALLDVIPENQEKNLRILLHGRPLLFPTDYGTPFINSENTTMVPVRGVSEAMKFNVNFSNNTVYISGNVKEDPSIVPVSNKEEKKEELDKDVYSFDLSIMGNAIATKEQLQSYTRERERAFRVSIPRVFGREYIEVPDLIDYYLEIGKEYGIRGDIAYLQAIKETNFFQFTGIVQPYQNNYSGIWATGAALTGSEPYNGVSPSKMTFEPGVHGVTFASPRIGVEAQIQHLYAYATTAPLPEGKELLSPRYIYVKKGCAPRWVDLGGKWAYPGYEPSKYDTLQDAFYAGKTYGHSILEDYLAKVLAY